MPAVFVYGGHIDYICLTVECARVLRGESHWIHPMLNDIRICDFPLVSKLIWFLRPSHFESKYRKLEKKMEVLVKEKSKKGKRLKKETK